MTGAQHAADQAMAHRILRCVAEFQKGCMIAGPFAGGKGGPTDPTMCVNCTTGFVDAVKRVINGGNV